MLTEKGLDESNAVTVPSEHLKSMDWFYDKLAMKIGVYLDIRQYQLLLKLIYRLCSQLTDLVIYEYLGYSGDERHCYITGSDVITASHAIAKASSGLSKYGWNFSSNLDEITCARFVVNTQFKMLPFEESFFLHSYTALSTWKSRFKKNGQEVPQFIIVELGETGSGKTVIAICCCQVSPGQQVDCSFESTMASIDAMLELKSDRPLIIDDYYSDTKSLSAKAEQVVRVTCDNGGFRRKMDGSHVHSVDCYASPVITAEVQPFHSVSSLARTVTVNLSREKINWEAVTDCQNSPSSWPTFLAYYVRYTLEKNGELEELLESFRVNRSRISRQGLPVHQRVIEAMAWEQAAYESVMRYLRYLDALDEEQYQSQLQRAETAIEHYLQGIADSKGTFERHVKDAFQNLLLLKEVEVKLVHIKKNGCKTADTTSKTIAIEDADEILILKEQVIEILNSYFRKRNIDCRVTEKAFLDMLEDKKLLLPTFRADGTRSVQRSLNGIRRCFIGVKKSETKKWLKIDE
jgi:hypothetical protein